MKGPTSIERPALFVALGLILFVALTLMWVGVHDTTQADSECDASCKSLAEGIVDSPGHAIIKGDCYCRIDIAGQMTIYAKSTPGLAK